LRDEWRLAVRISRKEDRAQPQREHEIISQHGSDAAVHVLRSKREVSAFLGRLDADPVTVDDG
jgi:hypothetical protein